MSTNVVEFKTRIPANQKLDILKEIRDAGLEPSPANLLEFSKNEAHPLHEILWERPEKDWAQVGRLEFCRHFISSIKSEFVHGGKTIESRTVEFVRPNGEGHWMFVEDIIKNPEMLDAYMAEIVRLNEQAAEKMSRLRLLMNK